MNKIKHINTQGFTLIELLVVVIIIAVLAAIAVPQYKKAVLKSRFSTVMPMAKSIADAQEVYYQGRQMYALDVDELDVTPVTAENTSVAISDEDGFDYVLSSRSDVPGAAYVIYQKHSGQFPGAVMCEANETLNPLSTWLCRDSLKGEEMSGSLQGEGWTAYLISGSNVGRFGTMADEIRKTCNQTEGCSATVNSETGEVTTTQCNTAAKSNTIITYAEDGTQTGYRKEICKDPWYNNASYANFENCTCTFVPQGLNATSTFLAVYDEQNNLIHREACKGVIGGQCNSYYQDYRENGNVISDSSARCSVGWDGKDGTCPSFTYGSERYWQYTSDGKTKLQQSSYQCGTFNSDGTCKSYKAFSGGEATLTTFYNSKGEAISPVSMYCASFSGKTCVLWGEKAETRNNKIYITNTCPTIDENTGKCPASYGY